MKTRPSRGFTLLEILVVMAIFGLLIGLASLSSRPDPQARLRRDGERLQVLFSLAADEAQMRARPMAWQADAQGYAFWQRGREGWTRLADDAEFKRRSWESGTVRASVVPLRPPSPPAGGQADAWVEFGRDGLQPAFVLQLASGENDGSRTVLRGNGRGAYVLDG